MKKQLTIEYEEFGNITELSFNEQKLVLTARETLKMSYSPYSEFKVGSAVMFDDGEIVQGSNQENVAYPSGMCAERVALFAAGSDVKQRKVVAMSIVAKKNKRFVAVNPCGSCLQVMFETEKRSNQPLIIVFPLDEDRFAKIIGVKSLMPFAFATF
jgi:cytidine deaminase